MFYIKKQNIDKLLNYGFELSTKFNYSMYKKEFDYGLASLTVDDVPFSGKEYEELQIEIYEGCKNFYFIKLIHDLINDGIVEWRDDE